MDPLRCLRDAVINKRLDTVKVVGDKVHFGDQFSFARKVETSYKSQRGKAGFYDLESLLYFIKDGWKASTALYLREAQERNLMSVSFVDRKDVQEYLQGDIDTSDYIQIAIPTAVDELIADVGEPSATDEGAAPGKRKREEEEAPPTELVATRPGGESHRPLKNRNSVLSVAKHGFTRVLDLLHKASSKKPDASLQPSSSSRPRESKHASSSRPSAHGSKLPSSSHKPSSKSSGKSSGDRTPIILLPSGYGQAVILNMLNAKKFFEDGMFETWETAQAAGVKKLPTTTMLRTAGRAKPVIYTLTDKPPPRDSADWARVVAVFTNCAKWQFKDWPFKGAPEGDLVEAFHQVKAYHIKWLSTPVDPEIKRWSVTILDVHRTQRHMDRAILDTFWKSLDHHLESRRSTLKY